MRISSRDRDLIDRRLRDRIPPALAAGIKKVPQTTIVVVATLFLTSEAMAKIEAGAKPYVAIENQDNADVDLGTAENAEQEGRFFEKSYSKEELDKTYPSVNTPPQLKQRLAAEVNGILHQMAHAQRNSTTNHYRKELLTVNPSEEDYFLHLDALKDAPKERKTDGDALRNFWRAETNKAVTKSARKRFNLFDRFKKGLNFNFGFAEIFSPTTTEASSNEAPKGKIKYGLVLREINPDPNAPKSAAVGRTTSESFQNAGHAEVEWTIGPLAEESNRSLFNVKAPNLNQPAPMPTTLWGRIKAPSANFRGNIRPNHIEKVDENTQNFRPTFKWDIEQEQGYYQLTYETGSDPKLWHGEHTFRLPLYNGMHIGRRFDDRFELLETGAYNIVVDKHFPVMSIHYLHVQDQLGTDLSYTLSKDDSLTFSARSSANEKETDKEKNYEKYALKYIKKL